MNVLDLKKIKGLSLITEKLNLEREILDFYAGDILSFVMGRIKDDNTVLLTTTTSMNTVAVAHLLKMSAVIFCDNVIPNKLVVDKAIEKNIILFTTELTSVKLIKEIYESIL